MDHALFVSSPSPGAVLRFLERLARHATTAPEEIYLSGGHPQQTWRVLVPDSDGWLLSLAPKLAAAFPPSVSWLDRVGGRWRRWHADGTEEVGLAVGTPRRLLLPPQPGAKVWARQQGLPFDALQVSLRVLDYETVAQLDQKSLLLEDTPRLYRFPLREVQ